jgi:hypothetical protein
MYEDTINDFDEVIEELKIIRFKLAIQKIRKEKELRKKEIR